MASNQTLQDVPGLLTQILTSHDYYFNKLSKENELILDLLKRQQKTNFQSDNIDGSFDDQGCCDDKTEQNICCELDNKMCQYRENNPDHRLTIYSTTLQARTNQDGQPYVQETRNQEQEDAISLPNTRANSVSKQSPGYMASAGGNQDWNRNYSELENTYKNLNVRFDDLCRRHSAKESKINQLEQELKASNLRDMKNGRFLEMKEDENVKNEKLIQSLQKDKADLLEKLQDRFSKSDTFTNTEEKSQILLRDLLEEKQSFDARIGSYEREKSELLATVDDFKIRLRDSQMNYNKVIEQRDSYYHKSEQQTSELADLRTNRQGMERVMLDRGSSDSMVKNLQHEIKGLRTSLETYQEQSKVLEGDCAEHQGKMKSYLDENAKLNAKLVERNDKLSTLHHEFEKYKNMHTTHPSMMAYTPGGYVPPPYNRPGHSEHSGPITSAYPSSSSSTPPGYYNDSNH